MASMAKDPYFIEPTNAHSGRTTSAGESKAVFGMLAFGVILAVGAIIFLFANPTADAGTESQKLTWRMAALEEYFDYGREYSQSDDMRKFTSESIILLSGDIPRVEEAIKSAGYNKTNADIKAAEADTEKIEELRTAGVNGRFDAVYKPLLLDKLESVMNQLNTTDAAIGTEAFHEAGGAMYSNLNSMKENLSAIET